MKYLEIENYKTLMKKLEKEQVNRKRDPMFMDHKGWFLLKCPYYEKNRFNAVPIKIQLTLFT